MTTYDVQRLAQATGRAASEFVAWLAPDAVDMTGEPQSFVELSAGRRLMVLAQAHEQSACVLLGSDNRCSAYAARPRDCRAFPFDFERTGSVRRLQLLPLTRCDYAEDGVNDAAQLEAEDEQRWRELHRYWALVARWNRRAFHRSRLHKSVGTAAEFLELAQSAGWRD